VENQAQALSQEKLDRLTDPQFYWQTAQKLTADLARVYHPNATDPLGGLTVPEVLAAVELAMADLAKTVNQYVPASHMLTLDRWRMLARIPGYYKTASNAGWLVGGIMNPIGTAFRYLASRATMTPTAELFQTNTLGWFASAFAYKAGASLIEMYSGRLRIGAERWRELQSLNEPTSTESSQQRATGSAKSPLPPVTIVVFGQTGSGKSSVINALRGTDDAVVHVTPVPSDDTPFDFQIGNQCLNLIETPGMGSETSATRDVERIMKYGQNADLLLLVLKANNPSRDIDRTAVREIEKWYANHPELKKPPILAAVTHIDLLPPALEWNPPYDSWEEANSTNKKAQSIKRTIEYQLEVFGNSVTRFAPVAVMEDPNKQWGVDEELLPMLVDSLDQARASALVRYAQSEGRKGRFRQLMTQVVGAGKKLVDAVRGAPHDG
jgi:hypothetical protein